MTIINNKQKKQCHKQHNSQQCWTYISTKERHGMWLSHGFREKLGSFVVFTWRLYLMLSWNYVIIFPISNVINVVSHLEARVVCAWMFVHIEYYMIQKDIVLHLGYVYPFSGTPYYLLIYYLFIYSWYPSNFNVFLHPNIMWILGSKKYMLRPGRRLHIIIYTVLHWPICTFGDFQWNPQGWNLNWYMMLHVYMF